MYSGLLGYDGRSECHVHDGSLFPDASTLFAGGDWTDIGLM